MNKGNFKKFDFWKNLVFELNSQLTETGHGSKQQLQQKTKTTNILSSWKQKALRYITYKTFESFNTTKLQRV